MTRLVVVGNGMVGARFVEDLLAADRTGRFEVTVLGAEWCEPYNRVLLSEVVAGAYDVGALTLPTPSNRRLRIHRGARVVHVDRDDRAVVTDDGRRHRYDQLVLATGSAARIPPLRGLDEDPESLPPGAHALRTIDDAREIVAATLNARRAVVLGAGVLGLEAACGLARRGLAVTVVHPASALMERQLDVPASRVVEDAMVKLGIDHRLGIGADSVRLEQGRVAAVTLTDGEAIDAELLVLATGTSPAIGLAAQAGLATARGVLVGADLASPNDPRVFAIGDCAQPPEGGTGLVAQGWDQARRLSARLAGAGGASDHRQEIPNDVVRLKAHGLDVVTMGICGSQRAHDAAERTVRLSDPEMGRHVEVVVSGGTLVGATCIGAGEVAADLIAAYLRRTPLPADPAYLLVPTLRGQATSAANPLDLPPDATVCHCNAVTKADIGRSVDDGATSLASVAHMTRATTGCGGCAADVCALVDLLRSSQEADASGEDRFTQGKHVTNTAEIGAL